MVEEVPIEGVFSLEAAKAFAEYSRSRYDAALDVYQWHENKAGRYLTTLAFLIGAINVLVVPQILWVLEHRAGALTTGLFVASSFATVTVAIRACWFASQAMKVGQVPGPSTDTDLLVKVFTAQSVTRALESEAKQILVAVKGLREINQHRGDHLVSAHRWLLATYLLLGPTLGLLVFFRYLAVS